MAFAPAAFAQIMRRALSIIGAEAIEGQASTSRAFKGFTTSRLYQALKPRAESVTGFTPQSLRALAQKAIDAANAGANLRETPGAPPDPGSLPSVPAIEPTQPPYRSDVVFEIRTPLGKVDQGRLYIDSLNPISQQEAHELVLPLIDTNRTPNRSQAPAPFVMPEGGTVNVRIIGQFRVET